MKIFLGYPSEHLDKAKEVFTFLSSLDLDPWFDKAKVVGGEDFRRAREIAQSEADQVIYLISAEILTRAGEIQRELKQALDDAKAQPPSATYFVPLRVEETPLPHEFKRILYIDFFRTDWRLNLCLSIRKRFEQKQEIPTSALDVFISEQSKRGEKVQLNIRDSNERRVLDANYFRYTIKGNYFEFINAKIIGAVFEDYFKTKWDYDYVRATDNDTLMPWSWEIKVEEFFRLGELVSLRFWHSWFASGAHGSYGTSTKNFGGTNVGPILIEDLFSHEQSTLDYLVKYAEVDIKRQLTAREEKGDINLQPYAEEEGWKLLEHFNFDQQGILFNFSPYSVLPYVLGSHEVRLGWDMILEKLNPGIRAELTSLWAR
jgi:hypothetical protein